MCEGGRGGEVYIGPKKASIGMNPEEKKERSGEQGKRLKRKCEDMWSNKNKGRRRREKERRADRNMKRALIKHRGE